MRTLTLLSALVLLGSCYYDSFPAMYPTLVSDASSCTTPSPVSFQTDVLPLFQRSCNTATCHNGNDRAGEIVLDNYTESLTSAQNGSLLGSIRHDAGYVPMPEAAPALDICDIVLIEAWIQAGTPEN